MKLFLCHCCSVTQLHPTLQPHGLLHTKVLVLHYVSEFAQIHVHWVGDAIWSSYPLLPSSPAFNLFQHQGLFQWVGSLHQVAKVLKYWSLSLNISPSNKHSGLISLGLTGLISLQTPNPILSREELLCYMAKSKDIRSREVLAHTHKIDLETPPSLF